MTGGHRGFIIKCSCGRVISQCRCICEDKRVEIRPHPACGSKDPFEALQAAPTKQKTPVCCFLPCGRPAEWTINHGPRPDDYTEACTAHVGYLLTDAPTHTVYPLAKA